MAKKKAKQEKKPGVLEVIGFLTLWLVGFGAFIGFLSFIEEAVQDKPYCYYDAYTGSRSTVTDDSVYMRVFVDCPK